MHGALVLFAALVWSKNVRGQTTQCPTWPARDFSLFARRGETCYFQSLYYDDWHKAESTCLRYGGMLAWLKTPDLNNRGVSFNIGQLLCSWFGLSDAAAEGGWRWVKGTEMVFGHFEDPGKLPIHVRGFVSLVAASIDCPDVCYVKFVSEPPAPAHLECNVQWTFICQTDTVKVEKIQEKPTTKKQMTDTVKVDKTQEKSTTKKQMTDTVKVEKIQEKPTTKKQMTDTVKVEKIQEKPTTKKQMTDTVKVGKIQEKPTTKKQMTDTVKVGKIQEKPTTKKQMRDTVKVEKIQAKPKRKKKRAVRRLDDCSNLRLSAKPAMTFKLSPLTACTRVCLNKFSSCVLINFHRRSSTCRCYVTAKAIEQGSRRLDGWGIWKVVDN